METFVPREHSAFVGRFYLYGSLSLPHFHQVDVQRGHYALHKIKPKSKSPAAGELDCCFPANHCSANTNISYPKSRQEWRTFINSGLSMGISKE